MSLTTLEAVASDCDDIERKQDTKPSQKQRSFDQDILGFEKKLTDPKFVEDLQEVLKNFPQGAQTFFTLLFRNISDHEKYEHLQAIYKRAEKKDSCFKEKIEAYRTITFGKTRINEASFLYTLWQESPEPWLKDILFQSLQGAFLTDQKQEETIVKVHIGEEGSVEDKEEFS